MTICTHCCSTIVSCILIILARLCTAGIKCPDCRPYCYTQDLLRLHSIRSPFLNAAELATRPSPIACFIQNWEKLLSEHQDEQFREYILSGLRDGFRVVFSWSQHLTPVRHNIPSAYMHPEVVDEYILGKLAAGNFIGPLSLANFEQWSDPPCKSDWCDTLRGIIQGSGT